MASAPPRLTVTSAAPLDIDTLDMLVELIKAATEGLRLGDERRPPIELSPFHQLSSSMFAGSPARS